MLSRIGSLWKPTRTVRLLAEHGKDAIEPKKGAGMEARYVMPMISSRKAAMARKKAIIDGTYGSFSPVYGGWLPEWDTPRKIYPLRPMKMHSRERSRPARADKITKAMQGMDDKIAKYRQEIADKRPKKDMLNVIRMIDEKFDLSYKGAYAQFEKKPKVKAGGQKQIAKKKTVKK
jgi:hypothetical protein